MKINISIDAAADEMREFLGLPDIKPLQDEMLQKIRDNMEKGAAGFDPLTMMKPLFPAQMQSMEMLQKAFWDAFQKTGQDNDTGSPAKKTSPSGKKS